MEQKKFFDGENLQSTERAIKSLHARSALIVCDKSFPLLHLSSKLAEFLEKYGVDYFIFDDIQPNPLYESIQKGIEIFRQRNCDCIIAVGGGSAIDVAKCIKLFCKCDLSKFLLTQTPPQADVPFVAFPSTAGSGSEATQFAVIYYNGEKQSITNENIKPNIIVYDLKTLETLPLYQKKSTLLDALCHAIEAFWSINSTSESREHSKIAINLILENMTAYLNGDETTFKKMFLASYHAGKAIDIARTTAGHAMSYKLTSTCKIAHGHAVALCLERLMPFMAQNLSLCKDVRGQNFLEKSLERLAHVFKLNNFDEFCTKFSQILESLDLPSIKGKNVNVDMLADSVNLTRLKNFPIEMDKTQIKNIYKEILEEKR